MLSIKTQLCSHSKSKYRRLVFSCRLLKTEKNYSYITTSHFAVVFFRLLELLKLCRNYIKKGICGNDHLKIIIKKEKFFPEKVTYEWKRCETMTRRWVWKTVPKLKAVKILTILNNKFVTLKQCFNQRTKTNKSSSTKKSNHAQ